MMTPEEFVGAISSEAICVWGPINPDDPDSDYIPVYLNVPLDAVISILYGDKELERISDRLDMISSSIVED